jgi:hypothetical protein
MPYGLEWDCSLRYRRGGATFLNGIDVYFDFDWPSVCGHDRAQFRNGQCLARLAQANCPDGKTPALLLTANDDVPEHPRTTDSHFFLVVNLPRYLAKATGNAAVSYYAQQLESDIARMEQLDELASRPEVLEAVLTAERVAEWISGDPDRRMQVRAALGADEPTATQVDIPALIAALGSLADHDLDSDFLAAVASLFGPGTDRERRLGLLRAMTEDPDGRYVTGEVLAERTAERIADARGATAAYQALLDDPDTGETRMQEFIEKNLWLLGLEYAKMVAQQRLLSGTLDFILERFDGFQDVLELKNPQDPIITVTARDAGGRTAAPPPSAYALSPDLAQSLGQVHAYRDRLTRHAEATEDLLGLPLSRDPWLMIIIGMADRLPEHSKRVLTELNKSLHRVQVVPYDVLARRADAVLDNVDKYLLAARAQPGPGDDAADP